MCGGERRRGGGERRVRGGGRGSGSKRRFSRKRVRNKDERGCSRRTFTKRTESLRHVGELDTVYVWHNRCYNDHLRENGHIYYTCTTTTTTTLTPTTITIAAGASTLLLSTFHPEKQGKYSTFYAKQVDYICVYSESSQAIRKKRVFHRVKKKQKTSIDVPKLIKQRYPSPLP